MSAQPRHGTDPTNLTHRRDRNGLEILSEDECFALLRRGEIGRVSTSLRALPVILPVTYAMDGDTVVFRTGVGTKFHAATRRAVVAFEVDDFDRKARTGWSVMVVGEALEVTDQADIDRLDRLNLEPWIPDDGRATRYIRIPVVHLSGRRIPSPA